MTESLEADNGLRPHLAVVASDLVAERDGHLLLAHRPGRAPGTAPQHVRVRATRPARAVLNAAQAPIQVADLAAKLAADFPSAPGAEIDGLIRQLIAHRFLLTSLRVPMMTTEDPLTALLAEFEPVAPPSDAKPPALRAVRVSLVRHNAAPDADTVRGVATTGTAHAFPRGPHFPGR